MKKHQRVEFRLVASIRCLYADCVRHAVALGFCESHRRLCIADSPRGVTSHGCGPVDLNVAMARMHGWTDAEIDAAAQVLSGISRMFHKRAARRQGKTVKCRAGCEQWIDPKKGCETCR